MGNQNIARLSAFLPLMLLSAPQASAAFVFTVNQVGANVVVTGSGTLNTSSLQVLSGNAWFAEVQPVYGNLYAGPTGILPINTYGDILAPEQQLGLGRNAVVPNAGSGDMVGVSGGFVGENILTVPAGYISGSPLSDTDTYDGYTIASLGLTQGVYIDTWGSGATADSLTINVVPEPASAAAIAVPAALALLRRRRRPSL